MAITLNIDVEELARLHQSGISCWELARKFNCDGNTIANKLKKIGKFRGYRAGYNVDVFENVKRDYSKGIGLLPLSKKYKLSVYYIRKKLKKLGLFDRSRGRVLGFTRIPINNSLLDISSIVRLYTEGLGVSKLSKKFNVSPTSLSKKLRYFGVLESIRAGNKKGLSLYMPRAGKGFSAEIKRTCFSEVRGICELCNKQIGDGINWRDCYYPSSKKNLELCYHHKLPIVMGGLGNMENCMVLHRECHRKNNRILHGYLN